ncbi:MAG: hypothetical protein PHS92_04595 [Candidatus Gracilibacteria bacterium]|nr:hypothetical protein [Candidatus Gracilibacteria bacterium]
MKKTVIINFLIGLFLSLLAYWIIFRPDIAINIVQGDLTPYFIDPFRSFKETISFNLNSIIFTIEKAPNFGSAFISLIFIFLSPFKEFSQQIYYFISIYSTFFLINKFINNKYSYFISFFITLILFKNVFGQYLLSPPLFHIVFVPFIILLMNFKDKFKNIYLYYILLLILTIVVSANLTFLFLIILFQTIKKIFDGNKILFEKDFILIILIFLIPASLLFFNKESAGDSEIQIRVNNELESYKISGYDMINSFGLIDKSITKAKTKGVNNYNGLLTIFGEFYGSIFISILLIIFCIKYKELYLLVIYLISIAINFSFKFPLADFSELYFNSPIFSLLRDYKKIGFIFIVYLVLVIIKYINKKEIKPIFILLIILFIYFDLSFFRPIYNPSMKVSIPYDYKKYDDIIDDNKSLLFLPISTNNSSMSQLEMTKWGFSGYNILHYFHTNYLDTARLQTISIDEFNRIKVFDKCNIKWINLSKFDFIIFRKDLNISDEYRCQISNFDRKKYYEDDYIIMYQK